MPVRNPAHAARQGEDDGKHFGWNAQRRQDDTGVEVDVEVQFVKSDTVVSESIAALVASLILLF